MLEASVGPICALGSCSMFRPRKPALVVVTDMYETLATLPDTDDLLPPSYPIIHTEQTRK